MSKALGPDKLTRKELARYKCNDCGVNVVTIGEFYMCSPEIWEKELGLGWDDNLCIGCLETRLGRKLRGGILDVTPPGSLYKWRRPSSDRLMDRWGFEKRTSGRWKGRWKPKETRKPAKRSRAE